jgi:DNA polymerase
MLRYLRDLDYDQVYADAADGAEERESSAEQAAGGETAPESDRAGRLLRLAESANACEKCQLSAGRRNVVFGSGNPDADLMFVGEGPGAQEDLRGLPFVGPAGELLTRIIEAIDLRREDVYIANIVKCRPPGNRDPLPEEAAACRPFLDEQVALVQPRAIVALGRVAGQCLLGSDQSVGRLRERWHDFRGTRVRVTYHPAALLRSEQYKRPTWEDMKAVRALLLEAEAGG